MYLSILDSALAWILIIVFVSYRVFAWLLKSEDKTKPDSQGDSLFGEGCACCPYGENCADWGNPSECEHPEYLD